MNARSLSIVGITSLALGVATGGLHFFIGGDDLVRFGVLMSICGATAFCVGVLRRQLAINDDQLAAAHAAGYALALDHVARGLLDQPTAPTGGGRGDDQLAEVRALPAPRRATDERAVG